jgi:hypothetical protein
VLEARVREEAQHLELRVVPRLQAAEDLHDQALVEHELDCSTPMGRDRAVAIGVKPGRAVERQPPALALHDRLAVQELDEQRVLHRVEELPAALRGDELALRGPSPPRRPPRMSW